MTKWLILNIILLFYCTSNVVAQKTYTITGVVKSNIETLPDAGVYISGYKISTTTDLEGQFTLANLAPGNYDILVQLQGYLPFTKNVTITNKSLKMDILLKENVTLLNAVVIKADPDRAYHLALFRDHFIGKTPNAENCKILNENALFTHFDKENRVLTITANEFLMVENKALGYRIRYMLQLFEYDFKTNQIYYAGLPTFEDMKGSKAKHKAWEKKRIIAYKGSIQHFYSSLYQHKVAENGFIIYKLIKFPNPQRQPDSVINANIKRLMGGKEGMRRNIVFTSSDSLSYWIKQRNMPKLANTINKAPILIDTLVKTYDDNLKQTNFKDALYVIYKDEKESSVYSNSSNWVARTLDIPDGQISIIHLLKRPLIFYANGGVFDTRSALYEGYWVYEKVADLVPLDYSIN